MESTDSTRLTFGLVAAEPEGGLVAAFDALGSWIRANVGVELACRPVTKYEALAPSIREGSSDVAWLPPVVYAWLAEAVTPLGSIVRAGRTSYSSALVVRQDASQKVLGDLRGARAGWVDAWSAAGYVVPRIELARAGIDPTTTFQSEKFYGTHRETLLALARGDCDVAGTYARKPDVEGGTVEGAWSELDNVDVRVLAVFGSIPTDVIVARRNLSPELYELALEALRRASADPTARELLRAVFGGEALREGIESGHDALRRAVERATANGLFD